MNFGPVSMLMTMDEPIISAAVTMPIVRRLAARSIWWLIWSKRLKSSVIPIWPFCRRRLRRNRFCGSSSAACSNVCRCILPLRKMCSGEERSLKTSATMGLARSKSSVWPSSRLATPSSVMRVLNSMTKSPGSVRPWLRIIWVMSLITWLMRRSRTGVCS